MSYLIEFSDETDGKTLLPKQARSAATKKPAVMQANMIIPVDDYSVSSQAFVTSAEKPEEERGDEQDQEAGLMSKGTALASAHSFVYQTW